MGGGNSVPHQQTPAADGDNNPSELVQTRGESNLFNFGADSEMTATAPSVLNDVTEVTCIICEEEFDLDLHLPKMLEFCHHTFCLSCLKKYPLGVIPCPYKCGRATLLNGRSVQQLTTNFYIRPLIEKRTAAKKIHSGAMNNRAEAINIRRDLVGNKLTAVHESIRILDSIVVQNIEQNNEAIAILQSLVDQPRSTQADLNESESDVIAAKTLSNEWIDLMENVTLMKDGKKYRIKSLEGEQQSGSPHVTACVTMLNYSVNQLKAANLLVEEVEASGAAAPIEDCFKTPSPVVIKKRLTRLAPLPPQPPAPLEQLVSLQFSINGDYRHKILIRLYSQEAPMMCESFLSYVRGTDNLTYENTPIAVLTNHKKQVSGQQRGVWYQLICGKFSQMSRVSGPQKKERDKCIVADRSTLQERKGALRMRLRGRCSNNGVLVSSEFAILCTDNMTGDPFTSVFGFVVSGLNICEEISRLDPTRNRIGIRSCGIIYDSLKN